jgi:xanthine phosphoribosyltransferase
LEKIYYGYDECITDCKVLLPFLKEYNPDALVSIARGGLVLGHLLSEALNTREIYSINSIHYEGTKKLDTFEIYNIPNLTRMNKVILVDDIIDSGETIVEVLKNLREKFPNCEFKVATIFYKKSALVQPDFSVKEAKNWIDFFWEVDLLEKR